MFRDPLVIAVGLADGALMTALTYMVWLCFGPSILAFWRW